MDLIRTIHGYESINLSMEPDYENNRTVYKVVDQRKGHYKDGKFDTYEFETPCEAKAKFDELSDEFDEEHKAKKNGKEG